MQVLLIIGFMMLSLIVYARYRNKIWVWQEAYLNLFGIRKAASILDLYVKSRNITENYQTQYTYIMAVEYQNNDGYARSKVIVTDSSANGARYTKGNTIHIIHNKRSNKKAILDYSKYTNKKSNQKEKASEKRIDDMVDRS